MIKYIKTIVKAIVDEKLKEVKINEIMKDIVADEFRNINIREKLIKNINEEFYKRFEFWNQGSSSVNEVLKDIMATQIWVGVQSVLTSWYTLKELEEIKVQWVRELLESKFISKNKQSDDAVVDTEEAN